MDSEAGWRFGEVFTESGVAVLIFVLFWRMMDLFSKDSKEKHEALREIAAGLLGLLKDRKEKT